MKNLDQIAEDLFSVIRGRFDSLTIGDDEGKVTNDPSAARFFDFKFFHDEKEMGAVSIALLDNKLSVIYSTHLLDGASRASIEEWYAFLKQMRFFAKQRLLPFDTRNISKTNLKKRDYKFLSSDTYISESLHGTRNKSYQNIGETRICIVHSKRVESDATRNRNINSIFIESASGERFKYPYKHLIGARAMARHVNEGGNPYDKIGKAFIGLSEELFKLTKFKRHLNRSKVMAEGLSEYTGVIQERISTIRSQLNNARTRNGYQLLASTAQEQILESIPDDVQMDWVDQLTIKQFNEELCDIFPYVYRLIGEHRRTQVVEPTDLLGETEI